MAETQNPNYQINAAFLGIQRRAEGVDRPTLVQTFVDIGPLFRVLSSKDHQIVYGRRGTGKTHALLYLAEQDKQGSAPVYVDLRYIGSSGGMYGDPAVPIQQRATRLLLDVLGALHETLLNYAVDASLDLSAIGPALDRLAQASTEVEVVGETHRESSFTESDDHEDKSTAQLSIDAKPAIAMSTTDVDKTHREAQAKQAETGTARYRVHFGGTSKALAGLAKAISPHRMLVILDEWSTVPFDLQPYLADLVRRALFPVQGITVKIAAIEQRSNFMLGAHSDYTGIEIGADASADVDLDDYMVFDNNADKAVQFFQELLFRHYKSETIAKPKFETSDGLIQAAFTQKNAFEDFVKAAEGVPRDAFNVLSVAAQRDMNEAISIPTIRVAARQWFQRDKEGAIRSNMDAQDLLHWIIDEVIAHRRARAFLLKSGTRHPLIDSLFDARLLHVIKRSISAKDQPGVRYDAYKLDYGCYVDLLATAKAPTNELFEEGILPEDGAAGVKVPTDDYRAIRRAILDLDQFEKRAKE
ncbi:MAG TPA: hypothetical protein VMD99_09365 [Terriglobales bacterium]|nr:hypothetical protein [Terriglobales bacterium]